MFTWGPALEGTSLTFDHGSPAAHEGPHVPRLVRPRTTEHPPMTPLTGRALVAAMCLGQVGGLLPNVAVPAIMAQHLMPLWGLSAAQAGLMASAYGFGYMAAVPVLTTLADRIDARYILMAGSAVSGLATVMFGLLAHDLWSATLIWGIAGIG